MARAVRDKVNSGEYASESEVIRDGLRALQERKQAVEDWLRTQAVASYDAMKANPARGVSSENVRASLNATYKRLKKRNSK